MAGFRIWGRIEHIAPQTFVAIVSAIPEQGHEGTRVDTGTTGSRQEAQLELERLMIAMGARLRASDHQVIDVE